MTLGDIVAALEPLANSKVVSAIAPVIVSSLLGAIVALVAFRFKSKEALSASITWQWVRYADGQEDEEPFLSIQNRSSIPAYLKRARVLRGNFIRLEHARYAFSYVEHNEGNFPLYIMPLGIASFPLSLYRSDQALLSANWLNKAIGYIFKRNYVWIEVTTIGGRRVIVPANDSSNFRKRALWVELRWFPAKKAPWSFDQLKDLKSKQEAS